MNILVSYVVRKYRALVKKSIIWNLNNVAVGHDSVQNVTVKMNRFTSVKEKLIGKKSENWKDQEYFEDTLIDF